MRDFWEHPNHINVTLLYMLIGFFCACVVSLVNSVVHREPFSEYAIVLIPFYTISLGFIGYLVSFFH